MNPKLFAEEWSVFCALPVEAYGIFLPCVASVKALGLTGGMREGSAFPGNKVGRNVRLSDFIHFLSALIMYSIDLG